MRLKTFEDLKTALNNLSKEQLKCHLTFNDVSIEEFYGIEMELEISDEDDNDVLDDGHPYFAINTGNTSCTWSIDLETN